MGIAFSIAVNTLFTAPFYARGTRPARLLYVTACARRAIAIACTTDMYDLPHTAVRSLRCTQRKRPGSPPDSTHVPHTHTHDHTAHENANATAPTHDS